MKGRKGIARVGLLAVLATGIALAAPALARVADGPAKAEGIEAGAAAAEAMLAERANDGRFGPSPWVFIATPGHWQPELTMPLLDPTPWVANVQPFLVKSSSQFRTAGPLALSSGQWATEFNEVKELGSATSTVRTP